MISYFIFRPTKSDADIKSKKWLLNEIRSGRLRQGWFSDLSVVKPTGQVVPKDDWVRKARKQPWLKEKERYQKETFCPEKYDELLRMTKIREGDRIIIPSLTDAGGKDGFLFATAKLANGKNQKRMNCYWHDAARSGSQHVVSVDIETISPVLSSKDYAVIWDKLEHRTKPVEGVQNQVLINKLEMLREMSSTKR
jgi:hypothetical protein